MGGILPFISPSLSMLGSPDKYHCHSASAYSKLNLRSGFKTLMFFVLTDPPYKTFEPLTLFFEI